MGRKKSLTKIQYPRNCEHCNYVSNNPQMYSYHKQTHAPIPAGTLCAQRCGQIARYTNTKGNHTCEKIPQHCPQYIKEHSVRIAKQWEDADERRKKTKETFFKYCCNVPAVIAKQKETKLKKTNMLDPQVAKEYRYYARRIRQRAQQWAREQGYILGQQTYHVDHKFSIMDSWNAGLSIEIVNHPANLQILGAKQNSSKGMKSSITLNELMEVVKK
jgi:hypothetical protein